MENIKMIYNSSSMCNRLSKEQIKELLKSKIMEELKMGEENISKEQEECIRTIQKDCLERTDMTAEEAWSFACRCWQLDYVNISKIKDAATSDYIAEKRRRQIIAKRKRDGVQIDYDRDVKKGALLKEVDVPNIPTIAREIDLNTMDPDEIKNLIQGDLIILTELLTYDLYICPVDSIFKVKKNSFRLDPSEDY